MQEMLETPLSLKGPLQDRPYKLRDLKQAVADALTRPISEAIECLPAGDLNQFQKFVSGAGQHIENIHRVLTKVRDHAAAAAYHIDQAVIPGILGGIATVKEASSECWELRIRFVDKVPSCSARSEVRFVSRSIQEPDGQLTEGGCWIVDVSGGSSIPECSTTFMPRGMW